MSHSATRPPGINAHFAEVGTYQFGIRVPLPGEVGVDAAGAKSVGDPAGPVLLHRPKICGAGDCMRAIAGVSRARGVRG